MNNRPTAPMPSFETHLQGNHVIIFYSMIKSNHDLLQCTACDITMKRIPPFLYMQKTSMTHAKVENLTLGMHGQCIPNGSSRSSSSGSWERAYSNGLHIRTSELVIYQLGKNSSIMQMSRQQTVKTLRDFNYWEIYIINRKGLKNYIINEETLFGLASNQKSFFSSLTKSHIFSHKSSNFHKFQEKKLTFFQPKSNPNRAMWLLTIWTDQSRLHLLRIISMHKKEATSIFLHARNLKGVKFRSP